MPNEGKNCCLRDLNMILHDINRLISAIESVRKICVTKNVVNQGTVMKNLHSFKTVDLNKHTEITIYTALLIVTFS